MNIKKFLLGSLLILTNLQISEAITLKQLIETLKEKNPSLKNSQIEIDISKTEKSEANRKRLGKITLFSTFNRFESNRILYPISPPINPNTIVGAKNQWYLGAKYSLPIFTGFKLERNVDIKDLNEKLTNIKYKLTKNQLIYNLTVLYLKTLSLYKLKKSLLAYQKSLTTLYQNINEMVKLGKKPEVDLLKVKYELESVKAKIEKVNNSIDSLKASIKAIVGDDNLDLSNIEDIRPSDFNYSDININDLDRIKAEDLKEKIGKLKIDIAKSEYYPQILFNASFQRNMGNDEYKDLWQVGFLINFNLFDFGVREREYLKAVLQRKAISEEKRKTILEIKSKIKEALNNIKSAEAEVKASEKKLKYAKEVEEIEKTKYMAGVSSLYDYLKAKAYRYQAESDYYTAIYDREIQITYLKYLLEEFKYE